MNNILSGASELISGLITNMLAQLAGKDNERWLEIYRLMSQAKAKDIMAALEVSVLKFWRKVCVGGKTKEELLKLLVSENCRIGSWVTGFLETPDCGYVVGQEEEVQFVMGDLEELFGSKVNKVTHHFLDEDFLCGHNLEFCEMSDALYLRRAYADQPGGQWVYVGMRPVLVIGYSNRSLGVFTLGHDSNGFQIGSSGADPDRWWGDHRFIWIFRRKKELQKK